MSKQWWEIEQAMWLKSIQKTVEVGEQEALDYVGAMDEKTRNKWEEGLMRMMESYYHRRGQPYSMFELDFAEGMMPTARRRLRALHILREREDKDD